MTRKPRSTGKGQGKGSRRSDGKKPVKAPTKARTQGPVKAKAKAAKTPKAKRPAPKNAPPLHWLVRPETIRKLWIGGGVTLAALVAVEAGVQTHGYFGLDGTFAFNAWYGFAACVAMVAAAKGLGAILKREDTYYDGD